MRTEILKNITTKIGSGATPTGGQNAYHSEGISLIRSQNVLDFLFSKNGLAFIDDSQAKELNSVTVEENDILLNITGDSIARVCIVPKEILPARVNQHVSIIRADETVSSQYLFYYLQYLKPYLLKICGVGGTRNALTKEVIGELEISISENQDKIAEILSVIDSKISLNNSINEELEQMAKTIYNYWFVQFDFPNEEGKPYKVSGGEMEFNIELKREIPKGWEVDEINNIIEVKDGTHDSPKQSEEGFHLITSKHLTKAGIDFASAYLISESDYQSVNRRSKVDSGDILISMIGTIGLLYFVQDTEINFAIKNIGLFKTSQNKLYSEYLYLSIQSEIGKQYFTSNKSGSIQKYLTLDVLRTIPLIKPEEEVLISFKEKVNPIMQLIHSNNLENQELITLRDFLLPLLMNGQVKVK
jgi:type I restriction enzyme S subunit